MFTSNIGRLRFFLYSLGLAIAETVVIVACIVSTIGFEGLINSGPGPSRQGMAGAVLIASFIFVALRGNIASRRVRDANGRRWILWAYSPFPPSTPFCRRACCWSSNSTIPRASRAG